MLLEKDAMERSSHILIVDDDPHIRGAISIALKEEGYLPTEAKSGEEGINLIRENTYDMAIIDLRLPDMDGIEFLKIYKRNSPDCMAILLTAYGSVGTAVEALKAGANDYITKPFSLEGLLLTVQQLTISKILGEKNTLLKKKEKKEYIFNEDVIGKHERMQEVFEMIKIASETDATVLLSGESGTGKELVADAIHYSSPRKYYPLIKVSCASLPESLLEAELFGYEKGAYTGALKQKKGRFDLAHKGTIFLDEIGETPHSVQVKLLRVLQEREFERLGGTETIKVDIKIICATQRDLKKETQRGGFREDLYFRLNVLPIHLPPLRERRGDILFLSNFFLKRFAELHQKPVKDFSIEAKELLFNYHFPGNVRELENICHRGLLLSKGKEIQSWDLPTEICSCNKEGFHTSNNTRSFEPLFTATRAFEKEYIARILQETKGNKGLAARLLKVSRKTLWEKCKALGITNGSQTVSVENVEKSGFAKKS
ncbi:MAG: sigma-54 dependent transcriptional regulator [Nitrospinota bacterium]